MYLVKMFKIKRNALGDIDDSRQTLYTSIAENDEEMREFQKIMENDAKSLANSDERYNYYVGIYLINKPPILLKKIHKYFDVVSIDTIIEN